MTWEAKSFKLILDEVHPWPELWPGDCLMVTELQRPGYGEPASVTLEQHSAYPEGLDAGAFNDAHAGRPEDIARAVKLQFGSFIERLGLRLIGPAEAAVLDCCKAFGHGEFCTVEGTLPTEHFLCHNAKEHALVLAIWAMNQQQPPEKERE